MVARLIAYTADSAAASTWLQSQERLRIGRDPSCDLVLDHPSVSRSHAEIYRAGEQWRIRDLGSKNGSFVDGIAVSDHALNDNCWLRLGDSHCEFQLLTSEQAGALRAREQERRALSQALVAQVSRHATDMESLPDRVLRGVVELSGCSRGFLLLADPDAGDYVVRASWQLDPMQLDAPAFSGSVGAVQRVMALGQPLVVNDIGNEDWLAQRASVIAGGLASLVCLPLFDGQRVFGVAYADRRRIAGAGPVEPITDFDLELLRAFTESATLYLLARRAMQSLDSAPRWKQVIERQATLLPQPDAAT